MAFSPVRTPRLVPIRRPLWAAALALLLAACGGGGGSDAPPPAADCSLPAQQDWLRGYMADWYFWYALSPSPSPAGFSSLDSYFQALLFGGNASFPADRYSFYEPTENFNRRFGAGESLGYGLSVAGIEVEGRPDLPLRVRYVEAKSDAAAKGLQRGDQILSLNGRPAAELIAANDYGVLSPAAAGQQLTLQLRGPGGERSVSLTAGVFALTPVSTSAVVSSPLGRRMGYVVVKDMIDQVLPPLDAAFAQFKAQGVTELVLDLRYNGGGLVTVGRDVASYVGGARSAGQDYARLLYNDRRAGANNQTYRFNSPAAALGLSRVYVLTGPRTCSASEQLINGLAPFVDVVTIGDTSCGKPVGYLPTPQCGTTYNVVNFESANARNEGRYFDGLAAVCPVADDLSRPLGAPGEALLAAAAQHADTGTCPAVAALARPLAATRGDGVARRPVVEPGEFRGMFVR